MPFNEKLLPISYQDRTGLTFYKRTSYEKNKFNPSEVYVLPRSDIYFIYVTNIKNDYICGNHNVCGIINF